jgi:UDP-galactopyranose mutase
LDSYFQFCFGKLRYRTLDFEEIRTTGDLQGTSVMNYADSAVPWTRITEHKYLSPWETTKFKSSVSFKEFSRDCGEGDIPYYPLHLADDQVLLKKYLELARQSKGITFIGRLGTYAYLDMDAAIKRALDTADLAHMAFGSGLAPPPLINVPS